MVKVIAVQ